MKSKKNKKRGVFTRLADLYKRMESEYDGVAAQVGHTCAQCPQNCCVSYFQHHTYVEWAYLFRGLAALPQETQDRFMLRAENNVRQCRTILAQGLRPRVMCPLNEDGLCGLYGHRLMICRLHGTPNILDRPDGVRERFPGCFRFEEKLAAKGLEETPSLDRTPLYKELAALEAAYLGKNYGKLPRVKLTLAEMMVTGPPQIR